MWTVETAELMVERGLQTTPVELRGSDFELRVVAEHEASHAITALALGLGLVEVAVTSNGSGWTEIRSGGRPEARRAFYHAGEYWFTSGMAGRYLEHGNRASCHGHDRQQMVELGWDNFNARETRRQLHELLYGRRAEVLALADDLVVQRTIRFDADQRQLSSGR